MARTRAENGSWVKGFFKILPQTLSPLPYDESRLAEVDVIQEIPLKNVAMFSCIAWKARLVFFTRKRGQLGIASLRRGEELPAIIQIDTGMIRALYCDPEARYLCVAFKGKEIVVIQLDFDKEWNMLSYKVKCALPFNDNSSDKPLISIIKNRIIFQDPNNNICRATLLPDRTDIEILFSKIDGHCLCAKSTQSDNFLIVASGQNTTSIISIVNGRIKEHRNFSGRCTAIASSEDSSICIATSNYKINYISWNSSFKIKEIAIQEHIAALYLDSRRILALDQRSNIKEYDIQHDFTMIEYDPLPVISYGTREIACLEQNQYTLVTPRAILTFRLESLPISNDLKKDILYYCPGQVKDNFLVVRGSGDMRRGQMENSKSYLYLSETGENYLLDDTRGIGSFSYNTHAGILAYHKTEYCQLFDVTNKDLTKLDNLPHGDGSVAVDDNGGLWLLYSDGHLEYRNDPIAYRTKLIDRILLKPQVYHVSGPLEFLFVYTFIKGEGVENSDPDVQFYFLKFSVHWPTKHKPVLALETERSFELGNGRFQAFSANKDFSQIDCCIGNVVFSGSVDQFFNHSETTYDLHIGEDLKSMTISEDGEYLFCIGVNGELLVYSRKTGLLVSGYPGSRRLEHCIMLYGNTLLANTIDNEILKIQYIKGS